VRPAGGANAVGTNDLEKTAVKLFIVIPGEVEESRGAAFAYFCGILRLRFASLGMTIIPNASMLQRFNEPMTFGAPSKENAPTPNAQRPTANFFARAARFGVRWLDTAFQSAIGNQSNHLWRTVKRERPTSNFFARAARFGVRRLDAAFQLAIGNRQSIK
jgi:hypothetical protein